MYMNENKKKVWTRLANGLFAWRVRKTARKPRIIPTKPSIEQDPPSVQAGVKDNKRKYFGGGVGAGDESESFAMNTDLGRDYKKFKTKKTQDG